MKRLEGKRIAILVAEGVEDLEFWVPFMLLHRGGERARPRQPLHGDAAVEGGTTRGRGGRQGGRHQAGRLT
jgi:hypothetical protein